MTVDGQSQPEASGELRFFQGDGPLQVADAAVSWPDETGVYAGVSMRRVVLARPDYFLDIFLVEAPEPHRFDWLCRNVGTLHTALPLGEYPGIDAEVQGYQHIDRAKP